MIIRKAATEDWKDLKEMLQRMINEIPPIAIELEALTFRTEEWLKRFPGEDQGAFFVAVDEKRIAAFCYVVVPQFYKPVAYIGIAVDKFYRKKSLGSQLFYHVAEWAAKEKIEYIIADVWSWNDGSIEFFKKLGFEEQNRFIDKFKGFQEEKIRLVKKI